MRGLLTLSAFVSSDVLYSALVSSGEIIHASSPGIAWLSSDFARGFGAAGIILLRSFSTVFAGVWFWAFWVWGGFLASCLVSNPRMASIAWDMMRGPKLLRRLPKGCAEALLARPCGGLITRLDLSAEDPSRDGGGGGLPDCIEL